MRLMIIPLFVGFALVSLASAQQPVSYAKQVKPFLAKYCLECHTGDRAKGGLDLSSYQNLKQGGNTDVGFVAGKPDESLIVKLVEKNQNPFMPPSKSRQPKANEAAVLRAWIAAGAKDDSATTKTELPALAAKVAVAPPARALAYDPAGQRLAVGGDGAVLLLEAATGDVAQKLPQPPGQVTALTFSQDGKLLAVAGGPAGSAGWARVYSVPAKGAITASPLDIVAPHADLIYDLALSRDGQRLATGGYDQLVKLWDTTSGKPIHTLKDHSDAVYGVSFSPDGKLLASVAADRAVKIWDPASGRRLYSLGDATDWLYAVAWSPDGQHLAAAGVDQSIRVWRVSAAGGRLVHSVFAHDGPVTKLAYAPDGKTLYSLSEDRTAKAWDTARMVELRDYPRQPETVLSLALRPDRQQLALGRYDGAVVLLHEPTGAVEGQPLPIQVREYQEKEPNDSTGAAQDIRLPGTVRGKLDRAGDVDYFRFPARAGQHIGARVVADKGAMLAPVLQLLDETGRVLAASDNGTLGHVGDQEGTYILSLWDRDYRGGANMGYRLDIGNVPVVTALFPPGLQRGTEATIRLEGVNLPVAAIQVSAPRDAAIGAALPLPFVEKPEGKTTVIVGEFPEMSTPGHAVPVPGTANGRISQPGVTDSWRFTAKKGQRLIIETHARRLGSPLDSYIEILDAQGRPVPRATLRCTAKTYTTFRDHDSVSPGIRIEAWNELAINDYVLIGDELLRILALPKNPDDDCRFFNERNQRLGYLGTTPTHHSMGEPIYKVEIHPPGATFPPNGLPVVRLNYRNDDGGPSYGKDSLLFFDPPADGDYQVRVGDAAGQGGKEYVYRLTIRPPRPSFTVSFRPTNPSVWRGGAVPITVSAERRDGFDGAIAIEPRDLPPGFSAPATTIPAGENDTAFALFAADTVTTFEKFPPFILRASATINGQPLIQEIQSGPVQVVEPGEIVTTTRQSEITVRPGQETRLTVDIQRRANFQGRVPLDVRGLPHGVRVLDIGLNGILITEAETTRTIAIYCEPWVQPTEHPFVVLARREGKNTEHAAKSVLLKVER
ncbi:MAG: c-type cytochrome domain-containing protein [Gemmataceae bacterium]